MVHKTAARHLLLGSAAAMTLFAAPATAQDAGGSAASANDGDEIIVTATRREERLQDVPVSVTAVSAQDLARSGLKEVSDIQYLAPNITFSATNPVSNGGGYQIRGVGTQTYDSGVEQTVGLVIDGVVIGLSRDPGSTGFSDIERLEVLRGPQGTLFGKNSSAGVIQVITKKPRLGESSMSLDLKYGERNDRAVQASANVPLGDTLALRLSGYSNAQDGAIPYVLDKSRAVGDRRNNGLRAKLLWEAGENVSVLLSGEYQTAFARDGAIIESLGTSALYNSQFARFAVKPGSNVYASYMDGDWTADTSLYAGSAEINVGLGDHTLTSITSYRHLKTLQLSDIDASPANVFNNSDGGVDSNQFTQELRLTSPGGQRLEYVLGLYYYRTENSGYAAQYGNYYGLFGAPVVIGGGRRDGTNKVRSLAAFGNITFEITDAVKLIGGLRYTNDRNHGTLVVTPLPFPAVPLGRLPNYDGTVRADNLSGKVGVQFEPSRDVMMYATYSTGFKGPAIDGTGGVIREVRPETVKSWEIGAKTSFLDGKATFNLALYWSNFRNFQAQTFDTTITPPAFYLSNAGMLRARGVEVETSFRVTPALRLSASGAYNDSTFRDYDGQCYPGQPISPVVGEGCYVAPGTTTTVANYRGYPLPNAPKWSYILRADYKQAVGGDTAIDAAANWAWRSKTQAVIGDPKAEITSYGLLNGTLGIGAEDGSWRFGIYARNLLDKRFYAPYAAGVINPGGYAKIVMPEAFRTIGGTLSFRF
ncbi:TonB-dependent receptor [Sphingopyxis sp. LC81]|uniref:TonB-dependent receptor n=1 Tax=Sphingopyxis sp. LC81 TaxID=1502850 RepID=UPI00050E9FBE|nr:TonB-dependent receptor [Sphingopyxis sp. LC81]KGB53088.1 TonB-dependent receptor [Sphingopyxis sp. LC81]